MPFAPAAPTSLADALHQRLLQAIDDADLDGFRLITEIALAQLGADDTTALITRLPGAVPSDQVPLTLAFIHGPQWLGVARAIVLAAGHQLAAAGAVPGYDFSYAPQNGHPVLMMSSELYSNINEINPNSLHLVRSFLAVQSS